MTPAELRALADGASPGVWIAFEDEYGFHVENGLHEYTLGRGDTDAALAELVAMERVVEAARRVNANARFTAGEDIEVRIEDMDAALAELDGQTPRGGASGNDGTAGIATPDGCAERQSRPDVPRGVCSCPAGSYNPGCHEDYCPLATEAAQ